MDENLGPLTTTEGLKPGDVCVVAVKMRDRTTGGDYWWKRFVVVAQNDTRGRHFSALTLKMHPDKEKDRRIIDIQETNNIVTFLPEDQWPQGVVAMRMKAIMTGLIKLGD